MIQNYVYKLLALLLVCWVGNSTLQAQVTLDVSDPSGIAGSYYAVQAAFGPLAGSISGELVFVTDSTACNAISQDLTGKIALVYRGSCGFAIKVANARAAGAIAVVVGNNLIAYPDSAIVMGGTDGCQTTTPAVQVSLLTYATIRSAQLAGFTVNVTLNGTLPGAGESLGTAIDIPDGTYTVDTVVGASALTDATAAVWYRYVPANDGLLHVSSCNGGADTRLVIMQGCRNALTLEAVQDDACDLGTGDLLASDTTIYVQGGLPYLIAWDDYWSAEGFDFSVNLEPLPYQNVTFTVDAAGLTVNGSMNIAGSFTGWSQQPMTDNGDGTWSYTASIQATDQVQYKFLNGTDGWEGSGGLVDCGIDDGFGGYNRVFDVLFEDVSVPTVCFGSCTPCSITVTFQVDVTLQTVAPDGMFIAGSFTGWTATAMTDAGNGVWNYTITTSPGADLLWKYQNGNGGWEPSGDLAACGADDGFGGFNRHHVAGNASEVLPAVCYSSCEICPTFDCNPLAIICDGFDSYPNGGGTNGAAAWWTTWSTTADDGVITNAFAASGPNSMSVAGNTTQDVVLKLGDFTTGNYQFQFKFYVPAGHIGYYNILHTLPDAAGAGAEWATDVIFKLDGTGGMFTKSAANPANIATTEVPTAAFTYNQDAWNDIVYKIDVDNDYAEMWVNGTYVYGWQYSQQSFSQTLGVKRLAGVDFYSFAANNQYYVDEIQLFPLPAAAANDHCVNAVDLTSLTGQGLNVPATSGTYDNTNATTGPDDPATGWECFGEPDGTGSAPQLDKTIWFKFTGDGFKYLIQSVQCNATDPIEDGDTQMAVYTGSCGSWTPVACNEDGPSATTTYYPAGMELQTEAGVVYYIMMDGFNNTAFGTPGADGEFCMEFTQLTTNLRTVTFTVDMANETVSPNGVYIAGDFQSEIGVPTDWVPDATPLTQIGTTSQYSITVTLPPGNYQYKFINGNAWGGAENAPSICAAGGLSNRGFTVGADNQDLPLVCFGKCFACDQRAVTFVVNMSNGPTLSPNGVHIAGDFQGWNPGATPLVDRGNGIWTVSLGVTEGNHEYKFINGNNWGTCDVDQECLSEGSCKAPTSDNRLVVIGADDVQLDTVCYDKCENCTVGTSNIEFRNALQMYPNPARDLANIVYNFNQATDLTVKVSNSLGQLVWQRNLGTVQNGIQTIELSNFVSGMYFVELSDGVNRVTQKLVVEK